MVVLFIIVYLQGGTRTICNSNLRWFKHLLLEEHA